MSRSNFSDLVKNSKMKLVLQDCGHLDSATLGKGYTLQVGVYKHCCTSGPSTWYRKAGISLMWWRNPKTATVDEMKRNFQSAGMVQVWAGTGQEANAKLNSSKYLRPGDIASMLSSHEINEKDAAAIAIHIHIRLNFFTVFYHSTTFLSLLQ